MGKQRKVRPGKKNDVANLLTWMMILGPFLGGMEGNAWVFLSTVLLLLALGMKLYRNRNLKFFGGKVLLLGVMMLFCGIGTCFWGISGGEAFFGVLRIGAVLLYGILLMQYDRKDRRKIFLLIPDVGVLMLLISALIYTIPDFRSYVSNGYGRMCGFFRYANAFALFMLLGLVIFTRERLTDSSRKSLNSPSKHKWLRWYGYFYPVILLAGIFWSGSRIVFVLTVLSISVMIMQNKRIRLPFLGILAAGLLASAGFVFFTGNTDTVGRIFTIFANSSTFAGRLLYLSDGAKLLIKHPLGLGYCGFFLIQPYEQTGYYVVKYVHNEWMQMALDYGIIAGICFILFMIFCIKNSRGTERFVAVLITAHIFFDFDLQFLVFVWILFLCVDPKQSKTFILDQKEISGKSIFPWFCVSFSVIIVVYLWVGISELLTSRGAFASAHRMFPWSVITEELALAEEYADGEQMEAYANHIIKEFPYAGIAYEAKAILDRNRQNYLKMAEEQRMSVLCQKYTMEQYNRYIFMLDEAIHYFEDTGQETERIQCLNYLKEVPFLLTKLEEKTNPLIYFTVDAPDFKLSDSAMSILNSYQENKE